MFSLSMACIVAMDGWFQRDQWTRMTRGEKGERESEAKRVEEGGHVTTLALFEQWLSSPAKKLVGSRIQRSPKSVGGLTPSGF